jgi:hypothetical protein
VYHADAFTKVDNFDPERICRALFNKVKKTISSETHEVIWDQELIGLIATISAKGVKQIFQSIGSDGEYLDRVSAPHRPYKKPGLG